jgi:hypothetical protein
MSKDTETIARGNHRVAALAALYQGEKTDASYIFNTAMAMMGIAVTYVVGAIAFLGNPNRGAIPWLFLLLLPVPLWLIVAFHSLITLNAMSHGISVKIIEDALFEASELRVRRDLVGSAAGDKIMDIMQEKLVHKLTTVVVYAGVGCLVIGFTIYALHSARGGVGNGFVWVLAIVAYSLLLIMVALSWFVGLRPPRDPRVCEGIRHRRWLS